MDRVEQSLTDRRGAWREGSLGLLRSAMVLLIVITLGALIACSPESGADGEGASTSDSAEPEKTAWQKLLDRIGPNGEVDLTTALQAFSVRFAPLPGVPEIDGADETEPQSGTAALRWIQRYWNELTPEQRRIVEPFVQAGGSGTRNRAVPAAFQSASGGTGADVVNPPELRKRVDAIIAWMSDPARLGRPGGLGLPYDVVYTERPRIRPRTRAATGCRDATGAAEGIGKPARVHFVVYGTAHPRSSWGSLALDKSLAHEVMHGFQCAMVPRVKDYLLMPPWLAEGSAEWAGQTYSGVADDVWWAKYMIHPGDSLFGRGYDAVGFFAQLEQSGVDWWKRLPRMAAVIAVEPLDGPGAFAAVDAGEKFLDAWAAGYFREPELGQDWDVTHAPKQVTGHPVAMNPEEAIVPRDGGPRQLDAPAFGNTIALLRSRADIVEVHSSGRVRISDGLGFEQSGLTNGYLCTRPGGCRCPKGTAGAKVGALPKVRPDARIALTGGPKGQRAFLTGIPLGKFCKKSTGVLACAIPSEEATIADIPPGRYEGTVSYTNEMTGQSMFGESLETHGRGRLGFTVGPEGDITGGRYSMDYTFTGIGQGVGFTIEMRIDDRKLSGTTGAPILEWKPEFVGTDIPNFHAIAEHMVPILESPFDLPMSPFELRESEDGCGLRSTYHVKTPEVLLDIALDVTQRQ